MGEEAMESSLIVTTAPRIGKAKKAAAQLQAKIDMIMAEIMVTAAETALQTTVYKRLHELF
eukprot:2384519-Ditylum_brightwellii.AAC.1